MGIVLHGHTSGCLCHKLLRPLLLNLLAGFLRRLISCCSDSAATCLPLWAFPSVGSTARLLAAFCLS